MLRSSVFVVVLVAACSGKHEAGPAPTPPSAPVPKAAADAAPAQAAPEAKAPDAAPAEIPPPPGEFDAQGALLFRVAACGGDTALPARLDAATVDAHCTALAKVTGEYREKWLDKALPFLAGIVPAGLPDHVVYPFGGSDLVTALATFPTAREITIISLEPAGDVRVVDKLAGDELKASLKENRDHLLFLYRSAFHRTEDLKEMTESGLPGHLVGTMVGLQILGYAPVTLRYFTLNDDGTPAYQKTVAANVEITFRAPGQPLKTYRHMAANLGNGPLKKNTGLLAYLAARAPYTAMTKASSFLLWNPNFTVIRDLLLSQMAWMISDATAPLPSAAGKKGFEQVPFGTFDGAEIAFTDLAHVEEMIELWKESEKRECPIRYGYSDIKRRAHLLVTRKKP
jgi:hypothetical protein